MMQLGLGLRLVGALKTTFKKRTVRTMGSGVCGLLGPYLGLGLRDFEVRG